MSTEDRKPRTAPNARGPPSASGRELVIRQGQRAKGGTDGAAQLRRQTAGAVALGARATTPSGGRRQGILIGKTKDRQAFEEGGVKATRIGRRKPRCWHRARGPPTTEGSSSCPRSRPDVQAREGERRLCSTTDVPPLRRRSTGPALMRARSWRRPTRSTGRAASTAARRRDDPLAVAISPPVSMRPISKSASAILVGLAQGTLKAYLDRRRPAVPPPPRRFRSQGPLLPGICHGRPR